MRELVTRLAGKFIVLDGPDGCGKTTQVALLARMLTRQGADVLTVRDPGGTAVGESIRRLLLEPEHGPIAPVCETMLFMASRAQLVAERIGPALRAGRVVLGDRYVSATVAYQGALGVDPQAILRVAEVAVQGVWPDLTIILDLPAEVGLRRVGARRQGAAEGQGPGCGPGGAPDRLESRDLRYHRAVRRNFQALGRCYGHPVACVRADEQRDAQAVFAEVLAELEKAFGG